MNLIDAIKKNVHLISLSIVEDCSGLSKEIIVQQKEVPSKPLLRLKILEYKDNYLNVNIVAQIISHRNQSLTESTKGRGVSLNWIEGFIKANEESFKVTKEGIERNKIERVSALRQEELKKEASESRLKEEKEIKAKIKLREREKERTIEAERFNKREIRNKLAIEEMKKISDLTNKIKQTVKPILASKPKIKQNDLCNICGGDGGVNGGCYKCDGTGWI